MKDIQGLRIKRVNGETYSLLDYIREIVKEEIHNTNKELDMKEKKIDQEVEEMSRLLVNGIFRNEDFDSPAHVVMHLAMKHVEEIGKREVERQLAGDADIAELLSSTNVGKHDTQACPTKASEEEYIQARIDEGNYPVPQAPDNIFECLLECAEGLVEFLDSEREKGE